MQFLHLLLISLTLFHLPLENRSKLLSKHMPAEQISTLNDSSAASLAVDGDYVSDLSCSHTTKSRNPWWQVNLLGGLPNVTNLKIYGLSVLYGSEIKVLVSNSTKENFTQCAILNKTEENEIIKLQCNAVAEFVRIQLTTGNTEESLSVCEVYVYGNLITEDKLLSTGMPASQSSTFIDCLSGVRFSAILAVDGVVDKSFPEKSCSSTLKSGRQWWQVYLSGIAHVRWLSVYSEIDYSGRLTSFNVMVSNSTEENFSKCATGPPLTTDGQVRHLKCDAKAKIVRIQTVDYNNGTYLTLCEVKIYGEWIEEDELLSKGMPANQSSTFFVSNWKYVYNASFAVDGSTVSWSLTKSSKNPWWQVNLGRVALITQVRVYHGGLEAGRQLRNFNVLVSNSTEGQLSYCASGIRPTRTDQITGVKCDAVARIVRIQVAENWKKALYLREVMVYGSWIGD